MKTSIISALAISVFTGSAALADDMFRGVESIAYSDGPGNEVRFSNLSPNVMTMRAGETIDLNIGRGYVAELDRVDQQAMGARTWIGRIEGGGINERVIISELNGFAFGRIQTADGVWNIVPGENGGHRLFQHPDNAIVEDWGDDAVVPSLDSVVTEFRENIAENDGIDSPNAVAVGSNGTVDLMVLYTQSMVDTWGFAVGGRVQYLVALLDQALIDSDTGMRARLVYLDQLTTNETDHNTDLLYDLQDGAGDGIASDNSPRGASNDFSALLAIRNAVGADLVSIIRRHYSGSGAVARSGSSCGVAFVNGGGADTIGPANAVNGVAVISDFINGNDTNLLDGYSLCSDFTFAHETGHNLGFSHNLEDTTPGSGVRSFAHGHRVDCSFRTVMAYGSDGDVSCPGSGRNEEQVGYFSNPDITLCTGGAACGIAAPSPDISVPSADNQDPADNARAAREEGKNVVGFRAEVSRVVSSVLPITRAVANGTAATAFATIINPASSGGTATGCGLRLAGSSASSFSFQTTTPANALSGTPNTTVDIAAGAAQNFVFSVTSATTFADNSNSVGSVVPSANVETDLFIEAYCANRRSAEYTLGLNSLTFLSLASAPADIIALAATVNSDGRINVPTTGNRVGIASVAISNVGTGAIITASADTGGRTLAITEIEVCATNASGVCITTRGPTATLAMNANDTATFAVFVRGNGGAIANDPANNRVFVRFNEGSAPRGATSVAVRTE
jgi:Metallo-peptidase family M12